MQETRVPFLGLEDALEKGMATHSSILAWEIPYGVANSRTRLSDKRFHFLFMSSLHLENWKPNKVPGSAKTELIGG